MATWRHELTIRADDGTDLARFTFADGRLDVIGDESRWTEAAARFMAGLRQTFNAAEPSKIRLCSVCNTKCVGQWLE